MANRRQQRVEQLLRREIAQLLLRGELRDPRLSPASAVSITGVDISGDLSVARIYVDVLAESLRSADVLDALASGAGVIRHKIGERLVMRRVPELRFEADESIARGARVERILSELRDTGALEPEGAAGQLDRAAGQLDRAAGQLDRAAGQLDRAAASDAPEDG